MESIADFKKDESAVSQKNKYLVTRRGQRLMQKTLMGWKLLVIWKNHSKTWMPLKDLKESIPLEVAEFAQALCIADEPAFCWWVPFVMPKQEYIISAVKSRVRKTTHKYGIEITKSQEEAFRFDKNNSISLWSDSLLKVMTNIGIAFEILDKDTPAPVVWKKATGHLIWDMKMGLTSLTSP